MRSRKQTATTVDDSSEFSGQKPTFTALPNWLLGKASALEIAVLWVLQSHYPEIRPSINRLAECANLSRRTVFNILGDLERKGWIVRVHRELDNGRTAPNLYRLTIWNGEPAPAGEGAPDAPGEGAPRARGRVQEMHGEGAPRAHEVDQIEEEQVEEEDSPSIPLTPEPPAAPSKEARKATTVRPLTADLPPALEPHRQAIADFWAAKRKGSAKSPAAFALLVKNLLLIHNADPAAVASQLEQGTQCGWSSITFPNWQAFGQRPVRIGNGSGPRYVSHRDRKAAEVEEALDILALMDPAHADPERVQRVHGFTTTTTAIDWENMARA